MSLQLSEVVIKILAAILLKEDKLLSSNDISSLCKKFFGGKDDVSELKMKTSLLQAQIELNNGIETILSTAQFTVEQVDLLKETILRTMNCADFSSPHIVHLRNDPNKIYLELVERCDGFGCLSQREEDYVKRCFRFISHEMINVISTYNLDFSAMNYKEILTEMENLKITISNNADSIIAALQPRNDQLSDFISEYMMAIRRNHSYVELFTSKIDSGFARSYNLELAYIELFLKLRDWGRDRPMSIQQLLTLGKRWLITGEAGCGKTTLLKWMLLSLVSNTPEEKDLEMLKGHFPVLVTLRKIKTWDRCILRQAIEQEMGDDNHVPPKLTKELNDTGAKLLLLIDGLDEIDEEKRTKLYKWLFELNSRRNEWVKSENERRLKELRLRTKDDNANLSERDKAKNEIIIVITSRQILNSATVKNLVQDIEIKGAYVQPMTFLDVQRFVDYWHNAINYQRNIDHALLVEKAKSLKSRIGAQESLSRLAQNPLLCAMICALHYKKDGLLPTNKLELYDACSQMLLEERDNLRRIDIGKYHNLLDLEYEDKRRILGDLALWMLECDGALQIDFSVAAKRLSSKLSFMQKISKISDEDARLQSELILNYFIERGGILHRIDNGKVGFIHKTFQEYFAAYQIHLADEWDRIVSPNRATDAVWRETIILAISFSNRKCAEKVIDIFLRRSGDRGNETAMENNTKIVYRLLAINCAAAARELLPETKNEIEICTKSLIPPKSAEIEKSLSACGNLVVPLLSYNESIEKIYLPRCAAVLLDIRTRQSLAQMIEYLDSKSIKVYETFLSYMGFIPRDIILESGIIPAYIEATFHHCIKTKEKGVSLDKNAIDRLSRVAEYCSFKFEPRSNKYILSEAMKNRLNRRMSRIQVLNIQNYKYLEPRKNESILKILDLFSISSRISDITFAYEYGQYETEKLIAVISQYKGIKRLTIQDVPIEIRDELRRSLQTLGIETINIMVV